MVWTLVAVIVGSFVYITIVLLKYFAFVESTRPRIKKLRGQIETFKESIQSEKKLEMIVRERVGEEQVLLTRAKIAVSDTKQEIKAAQAHEKQLELEKFKQGKDF
ncbi:MAG: hypothetical protein O7G87_10485 [bacterium]|nr:hypothetical protein [bacterium]